MDVQLVECSKIDVPKTPNELRSFSKEFAVKLADAIKAEGLYNPIVVRVNREAPGRFIQVQGRHRLYACKNVLKEQFIRATVIEDMDDAEAEQAMIAENLWRNPLTKPQHTICIKKWFEYYLAKTAKKPVVAKDEAGDSLSQEGGETKSEEEKGGEETGFTKKVAAATGVSERTAKRTTKIAKAFTEDQLEVFAQMDVNQTDMLAISRIKDEAERGAVVNLIASGMEVAEAVKTVMGDRAPKRDSKAGSEEAAEAKAAAATEKAVELTDDEWYDLHCGEKGAMFGDPTRFKAGALLYRKITEQRHKFRVGVKSALKATAEAGVKDIFYHAINRTVSFAHPKDWLICDQCKGKGKIIGADGVGVHCKRCSGGGYLLKTEEYL